MVLQQYEGLIAKYCKVANLYEDWYLTDVFIDGFEARVRTTLRNKQMMNPQADLRDIPFELEYVLFIQKRFWKQAI